MPGAYAATSNKDVLIEISGDVSFYVYHTEVSGMQFTMQLLDEDVVQTAIRTQDDTYILNISCSDENIEPIEPDSNQFWRAVLEVALSNFDSANSIDAFVTEKILDPIETYSANATGGASIIQQMENIHGKEYLDKLLYVKNDSYNSRVYGDLEYSSIKRGREFTISDKLGIVSFVTAVLGLIPGSALFTATCTAISLASGGGGLVTSYLSAGSSVLSYSMIAYYVHYGYCMGQSWVSYQKECTHIAYGYEDEYGVFDGTYELCEEPSYSYAEPYFDDYPTIIEKAIEMYEYWG